MKALYGNRAALLRAKVPKSESVEAAGGKLYSEYLPARSAATPREVEGSKIYSPSTWGIDYFMMGKQKSSPDAPEGFLLMLQPLSYFIVTAKIKKRSSKVCIVYLKNKWHVTTIAL